MGAKSEWLPTRIGALGSRIRWLANANFFRQGSFDGSGRVVHMILTKRDMEVGFQGASST